MYFYDEKKKTAHAFQWNNNKKKKSSSFFSNFFPLISLAFAGRQSNLPEFVSV